MGPPRDGLTRFSWHVEIDGPRPTWRTAALLRHAATEPGRNKKTNRAVDAHSAVVLERPAWCWSIDQIVPRLQINGFSSAPAACPCVAHPADRAWDVAPGH